MRITTLNLFGRFDNWSERRENIERYLSDSQPDIAFFQEVVFLPAESPYTQVSELNEQLHYPYAHIDVTRLQTSDTYSEYREGLGILSKFPIVKSETLVLRQHPEDHLQRIVQMIDIDIEGKIVKFANVQFAELPRHAGIQFAEFIDILHSRNERRIILGDFNIPNIDIPMLKRIWENEYIASSREAYISYPNLETRVDYILIPNGDKFLNIELSDEETHLSDHRALSAIIQLNG